jgi:photosynthetic reaction center H subunit
MPIGAFTSYIDLAQVVLYAFWIFFIGLIVYLRREDQREGYPLEPDRPGRQPRVYPLTFPKPKVFLLRDGSTYTAPSGNVDTRPIHATPLAPWPGAPLQPTGDPMRDGVGAAAYAERADVPDLTAEGEPKIVPLRVATDFFVVRRDPDPRGMEVLAADHRVAGVVQDIWVDRSEPQIRYLEVEVPTPAGPRRVLLPIYYTRITGWRRRVRVKALLAHHFVDVPGLRNPDQVTLLEEDRITAYYAGGHRYATPQRLEPKL